MRKFNLVMFLESIGFEGYGTGGGCMAMYKEINDKGDHIMITDNDAGIDTLKDLEIDENGDLIEKEPLGYGGVCIGFYSNDGECYFTCSSSQGFNVIDAEFFMKENKNEN